METLATTMVTGIMVGGIYALVALGWVIIFKCSGVLNLAMGELTLLGAYVGLTINNLTGNFPIALVGTLAVGLIAGFLTERIVLRRMIGEPVFSVIMITLGLSFLLKGIIESIWKTDTRVFDPAPFPIKPIMFGFIPVPPVYLWSFLGAIIMVVAFMCFFRYTRVGLAMQATSDDEMAALSMGISAKTVYAITWAIAFMAAGLGGALLGNINGVNISIGILGLLILPAVVLGGLNSIPGAIVGAMVIAVLQCLAGSYVDPLTMGIEGFAGGGTRDIIPFVVMVIILLLKPYGLWGWKRIERV